jgi:hypothetical protein
MKDAQDYIKEIGSEIDELLHNGNSLEESAIAVQTKHIAALEEKVNQLCAIRIMPTKACGVDALVRGRKEIEQQLFKSSGVVADTLEWVLFRRESI